MRTHDTGQRITRRSFVRSAAAGAGGLALGHGLVGSSYVWAEGPGPLLPPIVTGNSPEICLNSRLSYHSGLGGTATDQQIANVLWAAGSEPPRVFRRPGAWEDGVMGKPSQFSPEVRDRAVRLVLEHEAEHASQWAAIGSIAAKIGCSAETLRKWVRQSERDLGRRPGLTTAERNH